MSQLSRRKFLAASATAVSLGGALVMAADVPEGDIDAHSHIWTRDVARYPLAAGQTVNDLSPASFTTEELLELAGKNGIARVVLIQHKPYHGLDNSYITDSIAKYPGRFSGVACVAAEGDHPEEDMQKLANLGMRGFRIRPGEGGAATWMDSPGMHAMWKYAGESGLAMCPLIDAKDLPMVRQMCDRYGGANVVIDHFARIGVDGMMRDADVTALCDLARYPKVHVKISAYYALGKKQPPHTELVPMIRRLCDAYGVERLMWASDAPYQIVAPNSYSASLALVREHLDFLSAEDRQHLLRGTAAKVFFA
jgi:predicted TIM-barrel fold metal-dependent hydrolase